MEEFANQLTRRVGVIEEILEAHLPTNASTDYAYTAAGVKRQDCLVSADTVIDAMRYSLLAGGKRLRPMLMAEAFAVFHGKAVWELDEDGAEYKVLTAFMSALEMIHTYSLVHDDLPAMDNDLYRRGRKTTHAVYGAGMATLAGDGLLNYAFESVLMEAASGEKLPAYDGELQSRFLAAFQVLAGKAGICGMVGGQCADITAEGNRNLQGSDLLFIHENKTAAMIESALVIGGILGGAGKARVQALEQIGHNVGIAFQIQDDVLDVTGTLEKLGKPIGSDVDSDKVTYVTLFGIEKAREDVRLYSQKAEDLLEELIANARNKEAAQFLKALVQSLIEREK